MKPKEASIRIAILTEYYNSTNYGGVLQAYALTRVLNEKYGVAEQVCYVKTSVLTKDSKKNMVDLSVNNGVGRVYTIIRKIIRCVLRKFCCWTVARNELGKIAIRNKLIYQFAEKIPHSLQLYDDKNIKNCIEDYDVFVVGSDQVWRNTEDRAYWLEFVPHHKIKISYAASIAKDSLDKEEEETYRHALQTFDSVSVRESDAVTLLKEYCHIEPHLVLDPTLLISREEWNEVSSPRKVKEDYIFCYFLGMSKRQRMVASKYARLKHFKLVTIPYIRGNFELCDLFIGKSGERLFEVSPNDFISLIKHASCVITDSFHGAVFSLIYQRDFYVFERPEKISMGSRISSLMNLFGTEDRYCKTTEQQSVKYMDSCSPICYNKSKLLDDMKRFSFLFLDDNIQFARKKT